ncbi:hypothetical protein GUJ93_ZPchr0004g38292 [Zizania palustris]|uniref:DUF4378 domain-containing protein n=1 Tax=Zizania palustris TaxID=103762 RepID=A0A8J5T0N1_ZIZPA|nr:hypothetical protein GUJ93_ZPchr0004g38292 [Zizania palustris]
MELEGRAKPLLMLKEWLELESIAELSRYGFGCYPRHLAAELRGGSGSGRRRNGAVIERVSAAVRAALFRPSAREEETALSKSFSRRLRRGFWKKRRGEGEVVDGRVDSCSAAAVSGRKDGSSSSPAMSPRRNSWDGGHAGGVGGRRSHDSQVVRMGCETTCHLDEEIEQEQQLSPVSVMDFLSQDEDDDGEVVEDGSGGDDSEYDDDGDDLVVSPTFQQSLANIRRVSQQLLQKIRQFEQIAELDVPDVDDDPVITSAEEDASCHVAEPDSMEDDIEEASVQEDLVDLLEASSPGCTRCFQKLLVDFFRDEALPCQGDGLDGPDRASSLLETAKAWLDGQDFFEGMEGQDCSLRFDAKAEVEEIERFGRWRWLREDGQELLAVDLEGEIFHSLVVELVGELGAPS